MNIVLAMTGASGAGYAARLIDVLSSEPHVVHLVMSDAAKLVFQQELGFGVDLTTGSAVQFQADCRAALARWSDPKTEVPRRTRSDDGELRTYSLNDFMAPIASGSYRTDGMIVCPCSGSTLSAIVHGLGNNLIHRAADVHLKEGRPLIVVPRETPLSVIQLDNMRRLADAGAVVMPASPGWYHGVEGLMSLIDFMVARILDQLHIPHQLMRRWGDTVGPS